MFASAQMYDIRGHTMMNTSVCFQFLLGSQGRDVHNSVVLVFLYEQKKWKLSCIALALINLGPNPGSSVRNEPRPPPDNYLFWMDDQKVWIASYCSYCWLRTKTLHKQQQKLHNPSLSVSSKVDRKSFQSLVKPHQRFFCNPLLGHATNSRFF